jgi:hypothetical protein
MADNNLSGAAPGPDVATTEQTFDENVEDISKLLGDPEPDPAEDAEEEAASSEPEAVEDDDPLGLEVEAEDVGEADEDETDGSDEPEIKGGRFAPDTAKVTLDDGTVTTVADLKRNNLFQRDYTKKTTELKAEREAFDAERTSFSQQAQSLDQFREYAAWYAEQFLPKQPEPFRGNRINDPMGYLEWSQKNDEWQAHVQAYQTFQQQGQVAQQQKQGETQKQAEARLAKERDALLKAMPVLKDPVRGKQTWEAIVSGASEHYGITAEEVNTVGDHRMLVALRDALAYRRIKAKAPQVQAQVAAKPAMKPGKRAPTNTAPQKERQARSEQLRKTGSIDDAVALLSSFNL